MSINFSKALNFSEPALILREKRGQILAANLANADTPDYKARDLDFSSVFSQSLNPSVAKVAIERTNENHFAGDNTLLGADLMYRNPQQASLDGNTVEPNIEQAKYAANAVQYEASLSFVKGDFAGMITAIKGQ